MTKENLLVFVSGFFNYKVKDIPKLKTIPNLRWIIPLAIDKDFLYAKVIENCV